MKVKKGQGLLETIVAIGVITTGLISVISLVISNLTTQREASMRYQAVNLAREGIELVRNTRDSNWLDPEKETWEWDDLTEVVNAVESTTPTPFERVVDLTFYTCGELFTDEGACANFDNDTFVALEVVATVTWLDQGRQREVKLNETLYDWR